MKQHILMTGCCLLGIGLLMSGCRSSGSGGKTSDAYKIDRALGDDIIREGVQRGLAMAATPDNDTLRFEPADGILGADYRYWDYPEGKVGGLTYGQVATGPSTIVMPVSPDGTWSVPVHKHEKGHARNNSHFHIPSDNGHPSQLSWLPWWPYYTGGGNDTRYSLSPVVHDFGDGSAMCIMLIEPARAVRGLRSTEEIKGLAERLKAERVEK